MTSIEPESQRERFEVIQWLMIQLAGWDKFPNLKRWFKMVENRDVVQRALLKVSKIASTREAANAKNLDRMFGRGKFASEIGL